MSFHVSLLLYYKVLSGALQKIFTSEVSLNTFISVIFTIIKPQVKITSGYQKFLCFQAKCLVSKTNKT